jgi:hypothetical protein
MPHGVRGSHVPSINFDEMNEYEREAYQIRADAYTRNRVNNYLTDEYIDSNGKNFMILPVITFILWRFFYA